MIDDKEAVRVAAMVKALERHPDYRVLRRLQPRAKYGVPDEFSYVANGVLVDTETTGLNPEKDEVIELGMLRFSYDAETGQVFEVQDSYGALEQPSRSIPPETTRIHGITDALVAGQRIDDAHVAVLLSDVSVVIAHNAAFDRRMLERRLPVFERYRWACSVKEVPWAAEGFGSQKLEYLLGQFGFFHTAHRALDDCQALLEVLQHTLPRSGRPGLYHLLRSAVGESCRIWAVDAPYERKDRLKALGYRWDADAYCWTLMTTRDALCEDLQTLKEAGYGGNSVPVKVEVLDATVRYSDRAGRLENRYL
ncbi:3'-5' exonuclease [Azoarcus sp. KH32C]|uniref:3'-5' exonuclease n=1 Tax=Azoarcus sp. KH32C TaxID=748247 RepID=UPI00023865E7|nr:3'-5' exonuclease [Azoarcus sp. KH32C]BAL23673.1 DNA polymerase III, epsilon subunit [Azoarcus sp. KH32C]